MLPLAPHAKVKISKVAGECGSSSSRPKPQLSEGGAVASNTGAACRNVSLEARRLVAPLLLPDADVTSCPRRRPLATRVGRRCVEAGIISRTTASSASWLRLRGAISDKFCCAREPWRSGRTDGQVSGAHGLGQFRDDQTPPHPGCPDDKPVRAEHMGWDAAVRYPAQGTLFQPVAVEMCLKTELQPTYGQQIPARRRPTTLPSLRWAALRARSDCCIDWPPPFASHNCSTSSLGHNGVDLYTFAATVSSESPNHP